MNLPVQLESFKDIMELTDFDQDYKIYSYRSDGTHDKDELKKLRGMIFTHSDKLIHSTYYTNEYTVDELDKVKVDYDNSVFAVSEEGTMIRLFYNEFRGVWSISTQRKLDAFQSKWGEGGTSFGEYFEQALTFHSLTCLDLVNQMDVGRVYVFFLRTSENTKIVCKEPTGSDPRLFYIGSSPVGDSTMTPPQSESEFSTLPRPTLLSIKNEEDLLNHILKSDCFRDQGVLIYDKCKDTTYTKIYSRNYAIYKEIRGNEPSIFYRYLQVRDDKASVQKMYELYPESIELFKQWDGCARAIIKSIHNAYMDRYVQKEFTMLSPAIHYILKESHKRYVESRKKITLTIIREVLQANVNVLYSLVKEEMKQI